MKRAETLALINAGYTKAEIAAMEAGEELITPPEEPAGEKPKKPFHRRHFHRRHKKPGNAE